MKKKVVFVIESLHLGGAEKSLVTLLQNLNYDRYDVDLIIFQAGGIFNRFVPKEVNLILLKIPLLSLFSRMIYYLKRKQNFTIHNAQLFWPFVKNKFKITLQKYDVAIAYNQGLATYFTAANIESKKKFAWINTDYPKAGYMIELDFQFYNQFSKILTVSPEACISFKVELERIGLNLKVEVIKDISDKTIIETQANEPIKKELKNGLKILTVARLAKPKGLEMAIEACKVLVQKGWDVYWYVLGDGSERSNLEELIKKLNMQKHFFLLGSDANPYPYMKACDIYVQTSFFEGLGLAVIEASLLNKPIVCTKIPTFCNILEDNETGLISEVNADSIAYKVEQLIKDKSLRKKLSRNLSQIENKDKELTLIKIEELLNS